MRLAMQNFRSRLWTLPVAAFIGAGGFLLAGAMHGALSALAAAAAILLPSEWIRAKAANAQPQNALALALSKFLLTALLLAAAASALHPIPAPAAFLFGAVCAVAASIIRLRNFPIQPVEIGGNS